MAAVRPEDTELLTATVRDHNPSVGQSVRITYAVQLAGFCASQLPDLQGRESSQAPAERATGVARPFDLFAPRFASRRIGLRSGTRCPTSPLPRNLYSVGLLQDRYVGEVQVDPRGMWREVVRIRLHRVGDEVELGLVRIHESGLDLGHG